MTVSWRNWWRERSFWARGWHAILLMKTSSPWRLSSMKPGSNIPSSLRKGRRRFSAFPGRDGTTTWNNSYRYRIYRREETLWKSLYLAVSFEFIPEPLKVRVASSDRQLLLLENGQVRIQLHLVISEPFPAKLVRLRVAHWTTAGIKLRIKFKKLGIIRTRGGLCSIDSLSILARFAALFIQSGELGLNLLWVYWVRLNELSKAIFSDKKAIGKLL